MKGEGLSSVTKRLKKKSLYHEASYYEVYDLYLS